MFSLFGVAVGDAVVVEVMERSALMLNAGALACGLKFSGEEAHATDFNSGRGGHPCSRLGNSGGFMTMLSVGFAGGLCRCQTLVPIQWVVSRLGAASVLGLFATYAAWIRSHGSEGSANQAR